MTTVRPQNVIPPQMDPSVRMGHAPSRGGHFNPEREARQQVPA
ncbi:hypothetical protein [Komagataeibacter oboediens]|nr:hypothetical protein [Komagataeibacter oboediens]WEQ51512.1 hypothetical protein LV478_13435 [Komagataeibacter oboediens]